MTCSLALFTKIPGETSCKTRLAESTGLSLEVVNKLATAFLKDTIVNANIDQLNKFLFTEPDAPDLDKKLDLDLSCWQIKTQIEGSFSERLQNVADQIDDNLIIIGSDCPRISKETLERAAKEVESGKFVLGPSLSGGIYLIGLPKGGFSFAKVFDEIKSTELERFSEVVEGELVLLPVNFDVDVREDLVSLVALVRADVNDNSFSKEVIQKLGLEVVRNKENNRALDISGPGQSPAPT